MSIGSHCHGRVVYGWVAQELTSIAGSSVWFDRGFVTYSNAAKEEMLGVSAEIIKDHGAVSEPVVKAMAEGVWQLNDTKAGIDRTVQLPTQAITFLEQLKLVTGECLFLSQKAGRPIQQKKH